VSWFAAVGASSIALWVASRGDYSLRPVLTAAVAMGMGICGMHYLGMAALDMAPGIVWDPAMVALSALIAFAASAAALFTFGLLLKVQASRRISAQLLAALLMGVAICGMHYTGMAAARFPVGSVCLSADKLGGANLTGLVVVTSCLLLLGTLFTSVIDARLQVVARRLSSSLETANAQLTTANQELQQRAFTDALTGLPNRVLFEDRLSHALMRMGRSGAGRTKERIGVLFIDLDGFKPINDSFGHSAGDDILRATAARLVEVAGPGDTVARIGGDEFLLLLEGVKDAASCIQTANRVLQALAEPFELAGKVVRIACSIGIVLHPDQGEADKLVASADAAMYVAKRAGGGNYAMFESHMGTDASDQLALQSDLRKALELRQFELYYQPKIEGVGGGISGLEALVRWHHPERGLVAPMQFIPLAERFGLIVPLGGWVIEEACRQMAAWRAEGMEVNVAVNLSVLQLREPGLACTVQDALNRHGVPPSQLLCEITESVAMEDIQATQRTFEGLARIGVYLSIDDFGTGYSSLSHLRQLPARQLKIDRGFVQEIECKEDARAVVEAVIRLAHALGLSVVAEGVERPGQRDILLGMGCDELQGYFYAQPMPAIELMKWAKAAENPNFPGRAVSPVRQPRIANPAV
ncbi:MAG: EAL domain-containing protein, partial [Comamonadaceae bacterium]